MLSFRIVTDSSADIYELPGEAFACAPLKIVTDNREYTDDAYLCVEDMVEELAAYSGRSSTSCPNADEWLRAFADAETVLCVTITGQLSGSYNAACAAKELYEERYPHRQVFVLDSLSTGPEMRLLIEEACRLRRVAQSFEELCVSLQHYSKRCGLLFVLESMHNLAANGRVHPLVAKAAGLFGIRAVGRADEEGRLEMLAKCRGEERSLQYIVQYLRGLPRKVTNICVTHCLNETGATDLKKRLESGLQGVRVTVSGCGGLCSFYAERGGLLIGYETAE